MKFKILSVVIAAALMVGAANAGEPAPAATAAQQSAQAEIDRLVERIQVLSKQLGGNADVRVIVRRVRHDGVEGHEMRMQRGEGEQSEVRSRPGLGIVMASNPAAAGVRIAAVTPDSPAMKAGLLSDDVLLSVDGRAIAGNGSQAVENARALLADLQQGQQVHLRYARQGKAYDAMVKADAIRRVVVINRDLVGPLAGPPGMLDGDGEHRKRLMMLPPDVEMDIERMGPMRECAPGNPDCGLPALFQAFRWQGLNLASIDRSLGRYFGADNGVLVLSSGPDLNGLQSGDVIRRVAGNQVQSPREVMRVLREKQAGSQLQFDILRDRKAATVTVTVPKSRPLPFMTPPPPPPAPPPPPPPPPPAPAHAPHLAPPTPPPAPVAPATA